MQISGISSIAPIHSSASSIAPAQRPAGTGASAAAASAADSAGRVVSPSSPTATSHAAKAGAAARDPGRAGGGGGQGAGTAAAVQTLAAVYSTTVGGKSYSGSVTGGDGEYTASVPNLPGATASGPSVEAVEDSLSVVIDTLV
jgi:hypothetical protein